MTLVHKYGILRSVSSSGVVPALWTGQVGATRRQARTLQDRVDSLDTPMDLRVGAAARLRERDVSGRE